ncbi:MAG: SDR family oxidoreductase, partial [bacterium]|nr:SDR family oxidoreductase [bacterium]
TIGSRIAISLSQAGADIALHHHHNKPDKTVELIQQNNGIYCVVQADVNQSGFADRLLDEIESQLSPPDILINCAACQDVTFMKDLSEQDFDNMMKTNVSALFTLSTQFARRIPSRFSTLASIINISSIEAGRPALGHGHYATSKAAVEMLTKSMALEYGPKGLRVNAIAPGLVAREGIEADWPEGVMSWQRLCPLGRMAKPDDIARAALFLVSPAAAFITGTILTVDGGMSTTP